MTVGMKRRQQKRGEKTGKERRGLTGYGMRRKEKRKDMRKQTGRGKKKGEVKSTEKRTGPAYYNYHVAVTVLQTHPAFVLPLAHNAHHIPLAPLFLQHCWLRKKIHKTGCRQASMVYSWLI